MAACPVIISSPSGLTVENVKTGCDRPVILLSRSSLRGEVGIGKTSFVSCSIFGNAALSGRSKASAVPRRHFTGCAAGVACCQATDGNTNSLDIWVGRAAMLGFVSVMAIEIATGRGVLENVGLAAPIPALALALTAVVGGVTAFGIFRSANNS